MNDRAYLLIRCLRMEAALMTAHEERDNWQRQYHLMRKRWYTERAARRDGRPIRALSRDTEMEPA